MFWYQFVTVLIVGVIIGAGSVAVFITEYFEREENRLKAFEKDLQRKDREVQRNLARANLDRHMKGYEPLEPVVYTAICVNCEMIKAEPEPLPPIEERYKPGSWSEA